MTSHESPPSGESGDEAPAVEPAPAQRRSPRRRPRPSTPTPFVGPEWTNSNDIGPVPRGPSRSGRTKVSRRKKRQLRRRRRIGWVLLTVGGLIVLVGIYLVVTALFARSQLNTVHAEIAKLRGQITAGDLAAARKTAADVADHAHNANQLTSGPIWAVAAAIPAGGEPLRTIRGVTHAADILGTGALPKLIGVSEQLNPSSLRRADGSINLEPLVAARPALAQADAAAKDATAEIAELPETTWLGVVDRARDEVAEELDGLGHTVASADLAARIAPTMLGVSGARNYMISFQTEAELRGTGGLPGAFAIVRADHGKLTFTRFESDSTLTGVKSGLTFGKDFNQLYAGANATEEYADSNVSPNFPYAAQIWTAMWRKYSGQRLDGAFVVDPTALSYLLSVTGPAKLSDGSQVTATNVVSLTQRTVYSKFSYADQVGRKKYQLQIAKAISNHLLDRTGNTTALVRAAGTAAGERRLRAWSADPDTEALLARTALGGVVPATSAPFAGLSINNAAGNKMDYYLDATMRWQSTACRDQRDVTVTLTLRNSAPSKLPRYVYGLTGQRGYPVKEGDNRLLVGYFASHDAQLRSVTLNGKPSTSQIGAELGHPVYTVDLELPRGQTQTVVMYLTEPQSSKAPIVLPQPLVRPLKVTVENNASCG